MNARKVLEGMIRTDRGDMTVHSPVEVRTRLDAYRTEVLAEAKVEVVAWLVKKTAEDTPVARLADKVDRGAVRIFLGTGHYHNAMDAHRTEVLAADGQAYDGELAMLRGLVRTLRVVVRHDSDLAEVWRLLVEYTRDDAAARNEATAEATTATPDFFQKDRTYQRRRWQFQCLAVAPNPFNGEIRAVGFLHRPGEPATATALDPDDWAHGGWVDVTEARDGRG